jgi:hypothetical protein
MTAPSFKFTRHMFVVALAIFGFFTIAADSIAGPVTDIAGVYMANASVSNCSTTTGGTCTVTFPAVPSGNSLIVSNVSCLIATVPSAIPFVLTLVGAQETFLANGIGVFFDGTAYYQSTFSVLSVSASGQKPLVIATPLASSAKVSMVCTIAGTLQKTT